MGEEVGEGEDEGAGGVGGGWVVWGMRETGDRGLVIGLEGEEVDVDGMEASCGGG